MRFKKIFLSFWLCLFCCACGSTSPEKPVYDESGPISPQEAADILGINDFSELKEPHIKRAGEGRALIMGIRLMENSYFDEGFEVLIQLAVQGSKPYNQAAERYLLLFQKESVDWEGLYKLWRKQETPPSGLLFREALFMTGRDEEFEGSFSSVNNQDHFFQLSMAGLRRKGPEALPVIEEFFRLYPVSELQKELLAQIAHSDYPELLGEPLLKGKQAVADEKWTQALAALGPLLSAGELPGRGLAEDLIQVYRKTGRLREGGELFLSAGKTHGSSYCFTAAGQLFRWAGAYQAAADAFAESLKISPPGSYENRRSLWYYQDCMISYHPQGAVSLLEEQAPRWDDREYFSDTMEKLLTGYVAARDWQGLEKLTPLYLNYATGENLSRFMYIWGRLAEEGFAVSSVYGNDTEKYFRHAIDAYPRGYHAWLSRQVLVKNGLENQGTGKPVNSEGLLNRLYPAAGPEAPDKDSREITAGEGSSDPVFSYFCATRQTEKALIWYQEGALWDKAFSRDDSLFLAELLQEEGRYLESQRLLNRLPEPETLSKKELELLYPRGYQELIVQAAESHNVPPSLLFALVREESAFTPDIVSHAGAVGLGQVMPATAKDVAARMGIKNPDLTDPRDNLGLSAWYLNWLKGYVGDGMAAILAYNGGPGRIRRQRESWKDLPPDLALEGLQITETRKYGRKVFLSSLYYGALYHNVEPEETVRMFFPHL